MLDKLTKVVARWLPLATFGGSSAYWRKRYQYGGDSGSGSGGAAAAYKAGVLNEFVARERVTSVLEFGCGDGRQLALANYPSYLGLDISEDAVQRCRALFRDDPTKRFALLGTDKERADLALSLDVIFHLVEDEVYRDHLDRLFGAAERFVIIYSSNSAGSARTLKHVRHRAVSADIASWFPQFERLQALEAALPEPVETSSGISTVFLLYRRR
jgi:SAM-dependent methyltransferase